MNPLAPKNNFRAALFDILSSLRLVKEIPLENFFWFVITLFNEPIVCKSFLGFAFTYRVN